MLEREKNTIAKKYETKIDDYTNKLSSLEEKLSEWETKASSIEDDARKTAQEWEAKHADEMVRVRDLQFDLDKARTKMKGMEAELAELRDSCSKIDEYEQVLGKLMERNEELEHEAKVAKDEVDMAHRQVGLSDRRRAVKVKDLEDKIEEQRIMIEQQQETLDESVKTILKLYSLNNERGDDFSVMSEEKLTEVARGMVPRLGTNRSNLPPIHDEVRGDALMLTSGYAGNRPSSATTRRSSAAASGRGGRELSNEVENLMQEQSRARSRGRGRIGGAVGGEASSIMDKTMETPYRARSRGRSSRLGDMDLDNDNRAAPVRSKSRGRGERTESIRQLTERARTPSRRPSLEMYDPSGPMSDSRALVPVTPKESDNTFGGGEYDIPPPQRRSSSRRRGEGRDRDRGGGSMYDGTQYSSRPQSHAYDRRPSSGGRSHHHRNSQHGRHPQPQHHHQQPTPGGNYHSHRDRPERERSERDHRRERDRDRDHDPYMRDNRRDRGGGDDPYYRGNGDRHAQQRSTSGYGHTKDEPYSSRSSVRDPSVAGETIMSGDGGGGGRTWSGSSGRQRGGRRRDP